MPSRGPRPGPLLTCIGLAAVLSIPGSSALVAQTDDGTPPDTAWDDPPPVTTRHEVEVRGRTLAYTASAGFITLRDPVDRPRGRLFHVAYRLDAPMDGTPRPVTFVWNGGPGSSSALLHLSAIGPRRKATAEDIGDDPSTPDFVDNESTWLDATDLVFVDPVGTGYSRPVSEGDSELFWSIDGDIHSVAEFVRLYLSRSGRLGAPVFLVGESYGTVRAAGMVEVLRDRGVDVRGVVMVSAVLNQLATSGLPGNVLPYVLRLPTYTASAFAHGKLPPELQADFEETMRRAEAWALEEYAGALLQGSALRGEERDRAVEELARLTGLPASYVDDRALRVGEFEFARELLSEEGRQLGRYDTRITGPLRPSTGPYDPTSDPSLEAMGGGGASTVDYFRDELRFYDDRVYAGPFGGLWPPATTFRGDWMATRWDFGRTPWDRSEALARAMRADPGLRVLILSGYYDLATPYFATDFTVGQMDLDGGARERLRVERFRGGHSMYEDIESRLRFREAAVRLIREALESGSGPDEE